MTTGCLSNQIKFDKGLLTFQTWANENLVQTMEKPKFTKLSFSDTIVPRLLYVAQAIVNLIALPFKAIFAFVMSLWAHCKADDVKTLGNTAYAVISAGAYASSIPAYLSLAFAPTKNFVATTALLNQIPTAMNSFSSLVPGMNDAARRPAN